MLHPVTNTTGEPVDQQAAADARAIILVEGVSDRLALEALAARRGRHLAAEGISVIAMGGATNIGRFLERFGPRGLDVPLAGLYDDAEEPYVRGALQRVGFDPGDTRADLERAGFFACVDDLEDELIRAIGTDAVIELIRTRGELGPLRTLQKQPPWRGRPLDQQLRRFLGNASRKIEYSSLFVEALDLSNVPRPLDEVLAYV
jgi:hypothetical protein